MGQNDDTSVVRGSVAEWLRQQAMTTEELLAAGLTRFAATIAGPNYVRVVWAKDRQALHDFIEDHLPQFGGHVVSIQPVDVQQRENTDLVVL
jgi:hypothetical protein